MRKSFILLISVNLFILSSVVSAQTDETFKIFQFPADKIPRIDGNSDDWDMVPGSYVVGSDQLRDDEKKHSAMDPENLDVKVKVGWVKGMNKLYFLYEAYDNYWDFSRVGLHHEVELIGTDCFVTIEVGLTMTTGGNRTGLLRLPFCQAKRETKQ